MSSSLQERTVSGVFWSSLHRFGSMAITFVSNIVLARLLSPTDFGCIGMLMIFISLSNTFIDGGFGSALIQKKSPTNTDYSTIFFWNIFLSVVLYIVLFLLAPFIAGFYRIPLLSSVLRVQGVVLFFNALNIIQFNQLRKNLQFKKLAIIELFSASISLTVTIIFAVLGYGVWSLVFQQISLSLFRSISLWMLNKWRPLFVLSKESFRELFNFGGFMLVSNLFSSFSNEVQGLLVGRMFSPAIMGLYTQAFRLEAAFSTSISSILNQVTYPVMSSIQDDKEKLVSALKLFVQVPAYLCLYILGIAILVAHPIILFLYGEQWLSCVPYFQILCIAGLAVCLQGSTDLSIATIGKSKIFFKWTIIKRTLTIIFCVLGILLWGFYGLLFACVCGAWTVYLINAYLVHKHIGYPFFSQIWDILPFILLATLDGLFVHCICMDLNIGIWGGAIVHVILFTIIYFITSKILRFQIYDFIMSIIKNKVFKK